MAAHMMDTHLWLELHLVKTVKLLSLRMEGVERIIRCSLLFMLFFLDHGGTVVLHFLLAYVLFIFGSEPGCTEGHLQFRVRMGI